jgi:activator of 2-hydroxyglutaryl-CoA dehydratase
MFDALGEALGKKLTRLPHPQVNGAIGAALFAAQAAESAAGKSLAAAGV